MTYVINKALKLKEKNNPDLYSPGQPCTHKCEETCVKGGCKKCKQTQKIVKYVQRTRCIKLNQIIYSFFFPIQNCFTKLNLQ